MFSSSSTRPLKELIHEAQTPRRSLSGSGRASFAAAAAAAAAEQGPTPARFEAVAQLADALADAGAATAHSEGVMAEVEKMDDVSRAGLAVCSGSGQCQPCWLATILSSSDKADCGTGQPARSLLGGSIHAD